MQRLGRGCLAVLLAAGVAGAEPAAVKRVAAPPSDIVAGVVTLPEPDQLGERSHTALLPVRLEQAAGGWAWTGVVHLGGDDASLAVIAPDHWEIGLSGPGGVALPVPAPGGLASRIAGRPDAWITTATGDLPPELGTAPVRRLFLHGLDAGPHEIVLRSPAPGEGFLLVDAGNGASLYTHPTALRRVVGEPVGLRAWLDGARPTVMTADVFTPDGTSRTVRADEEEIVRFTPTAPGPHAVRVEARGVDTAGRPVVLTTQHLVEVFDPSPPLVIDGLRTADGVLIVNLGGLAGRRSITAAEVWGLRDGVRVPVCFVSQLGDGQRTLAIDLRWAALAGIDPDSLELRRVREHEVGSFGLVAYADSLDLPSVSLTLPPVPDHVRPDMLTGSPGAASVESPLVTIGTSRAVSPGHRLLLVHGYCSGGNPFPVSHFTGDVSTFEDPNQSRTLDGFAQLLLSQASAAKSFGVVGHSQGPMAALHLRTYYWSGLDWAQGNRLIQAVGAPFQGTPLAGNAAVLGQIFGAGCGSNADLTYAGAAAWLSLIPTWAREDVWYWTTSFNDRPFLYDYCNIITDLLLSDPDDGVIERDRGQLPGATNRGHREGWCHTAGMRDPAQTTDLARNGEMNLEARR